MSAVERKDIVSRVKAIVMSPKSEWPVIAEETATVADIYTKYVILLAAIPAVVGFIVASFIGINIPFGGTFRVPIMSGLSSALVTYVLSLAGIYIVALIVDALAPTFGGTKNQIQALKVTAYAYTAYWVASIAQIIPGIGMLIVLAGGIYSLYLFYLGLPVLMKSPSERALPYTAVVVLSAIVIGFVMMMMVVSMFGLGGAMNMGAINNGAAGSGAQTQFDPDSPLGQLEAMANRMEQAGENLESAQQSGTPEEQQQALSQFFGTVLGGGGNVEALSAQQIGSFAPETLAGLPRTEISSERNAMLGIQVSQTRATYSDAAGQSLELEIMDTGGASGLLGVATWANLEEETQTATGYERTYRENGRLIHEAWDSESGSGEYGVIAGDRFLVQASGNVTNIEVLRNAVASVDIVGLENLAP